MINISQSLRYSKIANLEAEIILANILNKDRSFLHTHPDLTLSNKIEGSFVLKCKRRLAQEPLDYILGFKEFYGLKFYVDKNVLIPRPETEDLVDQVIDYAKDRPVTICDVGTGSGCIAISLAKNLTYASIFATDTDLKALNIAKRNAKLHNVDSKIKFLHGRLILPIKKNINIIVANLPYIKTKKLNTLEPKIKDWEPRKALDGGTDGMRIYEKLFLSAKKYLNQGDKIFYEFDGRVKTRIIQ